MGVLADPAGPPGDREESKADAELKDKTRIRSRQVFRLISDLP